MMSKHKFNKKIIVILGPSASGKSNLGVFLAKKLGGEIISADSRQVYKRLNIGSGKITKKEMMSVPHHCLDIANPKKVFTAYNFQRCARKAIEKIWKKGKIPIIAGGTGFYIDAAVGRVSLSNVPPDPKLRKRLKRKSAKELFSILKKIDPKKAKSIDRNNLVRLIRAIEILKGKSLVFSQTDNSSAPAAADYLHSRHKNCPLCYRTTPRRADQAFCARESFSKTQGIRPKQILWLGIKRSKEDLKKRIHKRLIARLPGIIKEIKKLRNPQSAHSGGGGGVSWKRLYELGLEYRYVSLYLQKKLKKDAMIKKLESEINKYAKRQMTYWRRNKEIKWLSTKQAKKLGQRFSLA